MNAQPPPAPSPPESASEGSAREVLNVFGDYSREKARLEDMQQASLNLLEDFAAEKVRLEETQRAMLNLLDDFAMERERIEAANFELREAVDSLRRAKEAVDAANRELEAFAYSVSHDLRAPLRSIAGFSHVVYEDSFHALDDEAKDALKRIMSATERMSQLIDDLLDLSRITRADMRRGPLDLSLIVRRVAAGIRNHQPERDVEFVIEDGLAAQGDDRLLNIVFENLVGNAWKFTSKCRTARIEFGAAKRDGCTAYFIRDNGIGFDMAYAGKLFQPFQRLHSVNDFPGTGIGLATVKRIIDRHGGRVWIEGETDRGTTVYFTL